MQGAAQGLKQISIPGWCLSQEALPVEREREPKHYKMKKASILVEGGYHRCYLLYGQALTAWDGFEEKEWERERNPRVTYLIGVILGAPYLEPSHVPWVSCCFQTILIALQEKF